MYHVIKTQVSGADGKLIDLKLNLMRVTGSVSKHYYAGFSLIKYIII